MPAISRKTRNWVLALILIPAAVYGVAKLAIWYSVKDGLDTVQESMAPFASLEYSNILSPVFGPFGATGISIKPHIFEDSITVGSALVRIDDPIEKYEYLRASLRDTIPTKFKFSLNRVRIPLDGDIASWFNQNAASPAATSGPPSACETGTGFTLADIKKMGYEELAANILAEYSYDRRVGGLSTYFRMEVRDMFEITMEGRVPSSDVVLSVDRISGVPRLSDMTLTLSDLSWSTRFNSYCADALGISEAQYVQKRMQDTRQAFLDSGFEPSAELMAGLEKFVRGASPLTVSLNPREPVNPTGVDMNQDPEFLIDSLGIEVMVDGAPIRNLGAVKEVAVEEQEEETKVIDETFKPTSISELPQFLKSSVRIFTDDGKVHEGYLDSVDTEKIVLTRHLVGGSVTFDVGRSEVNRVLVLRP